MKNIIKISLIFLILFYFFANTYYVNAENSIESAVSLNSEAAILIENESGNILYEKNSSERLYPASTTKIMTAILAIENCDLNETAEVSQGAVNSVPSGYTNAGLIPGEEFTVEELLYALMIASANEAANVLAEHISGSVEEFAVLMNEKAKELGCENTNFVNANGMHNENHYTTAQDLCTIAEYCFENETFREIIQTVNYTVPATELHSAEDRILTNTDALINPNSQYYYEYALGGKTGFTSQAGNCLVCFAEKDGIYLTAVLLNASSSVNRFSDARNLLSFGYDNFSNQVLVPKDTAIETLEISNGEEGANTVQIVTGEEITDYVQNNFENNLSYEITLNENILAPVYLGSTLGEITYTLDNKTYTVPLVAGNTVYSAHNYASYFLAAGLVLLIISIIIIPKKKKR